MYCRGFCFDLVTRVWDVFFHEGSPPLVLTVNMNPIPFSQTHIHAHIHIHTHSLVILSASTHFDNQSYQLTLLINPIN